MIPVVAIYQEELIKVEREGNIKCPNNFMEANVIDHFAPTLFSFKLV